MEQPLLIMHKSLSAALQMCLVLVHEKTIHQPHCGFTIGRALCSELCGQTPAHSSLNLSCKHGHSSLSVAVQMRLVLDT